MHKRIYGGDCDEEDDDDDTGFDDADINGDDDDKIQDTRNFI